MIPICILAIEDDSDREYMTAVYIQYHRLMYKTVLNTVKNAAMADDIVQTALENLIKKIPKLRTMDDTHLVNYIITTCKNTSINELRRRQQDIKWLVNKNFVFCDPGPQISEIEDRLVLQEDHSQLWKVWSQLGERDQYLLEARHILEKEPMEIAADLNIPPANVRMALTRARRKVQRLLLELEQTQ